MTRLRVSEERIVEDKEPRNAASRLLCGGLQSSIRDPGFTPDFEQLILSFDKLLD
jgi:hypothetical protein